MNDDEKQQIIDAMRQSFDDGNEAPGLSSISLNFTSPKGYVATYKANSKGWYTLNRSSSGSGRLYAGPLVAIDNATPDLKNGINLPLESPQTFWLMRNEVIHVWRNSSDVTISLMYWGSKKPDFLTAWNQSESETMILILEDGSLVGTLPPNTGINFESPLTATEDSPYKDIGIDIAALQTLLGSPEFLWHEVNYDIHCDHFGGANGIYHDIAEKVVPQDMNETVPILNDYWNISKNILIQAVE